MKQDGGSAPAAVDGGSERPPTPSEDASGGSVPALQTLPQAAGTELQRRKSLLELALDNTKHGIAMFDAQGELIVCNARYRSIYGFSAEVVQPGASIEQILKHSITLGNYSDEEARRALTERLLQIASRKPSTYRQHLRDGRTIEVSHQPVSYGLSVTTCEDITEILRRERVSAEMARAAALADTENAAKSAFLANMSHELRTPLNAIRGFAEAMQQELFGPLGNDGGYQGYATSIVEGAQQLQHIIDQTLEMAQLTDGGVVLDETCLDLVELVRGVVAGFAPAAEGKRLSLRLALDDGPMWYMADAAKLERALASLLDNAVKFSAPGGVIAISAWQAASEGPTVSISDAGPGIAGDRIEHVLRPFGQDEGAEVREHHGAGLGLPIAEGLIKLHGGRLEIDSRPGAGTVVSVILPADRLMESVSPGASRQRSGGRTR